MPFCPVMAAERRYNDGRLDDAIESLTMEWIADESDELAEALLHAFGKLDQHEFLIAVFAGGEYMTKAREQLRELTVEKLDDMALAELERQP